MTQDQKYKLDTSNGDVWDIGQTVNGVSRFIFIEGKWHYYSDRLMREYEYDQDELSDLILKDQINEEGECEYIGNVFHYILEK